MPLYYYRVKVPEGGWVRLIRSTAVLPLPKDCFSECRLPGRRVPNGEVIGLNQWDFLITAEPKSLKRNWGFSYELTLFGYTAGEKLPHWWTIPWGADHKAYIKQVGGHEDLLPGARDISAMVREIHAIRRKIISVPVRELIPPKKPRKPSEAQLANRQLREQFTQDHFEYARSVNQMRESRYQEDLSRRREELLGDGWSEEDDHGQD